MTVAVHQRSVARLSVHERRDSTPRCGRCHCRLPEPDGPTRCSYCGYEIVEYRGHRVMVADPPGVWR